MTAATPAALPLTGPPQLPGSSITVSGVCHHLPILAGATDTEWIATGAVHDGDLILGTNRASGDVRVHYSTAAEWRALSLAATRIADWLEDTV